MARIIRPKRLQTDPERQPQEGEFCRASRRARAYIDERMESADPIKKDIVWINTVKEFHKRFNILLSADMSMFEYKIWGVADSDESQVWNAPDKSTPEQVGGLVKTLCNALEAMETRLLEKEIVRYAMEEGNEAYIILDDHWRTKSTTYIFHIREVVSKAELAESLRERIFTRLNQLQNEIDRNRTRVESISEVFLVVTEAVGKGAKRLEGAIRIIERLAGALAGARTAALEHEITPKLPAPETFGLSDLE
jgi:hypothetical protein